MNITKNEKLVELLLTDHVDLRDNLMKMIANIWWEQLRNSNREKMTAFEFLEVLSKNKLKNATSLDRAWRLVQVKNPPIRGKYYYKRRSEGVRHTKENLGYIYSAQQTIKF